ncbi:MAG: radical SAM protein [Candidatus Caldarchaeum sp.]
MLYFLRVVERLVPPGVVAGRFRVRPPLVKPSKLTLDRSGKNLSQGWAVNFAVGCTHACKFCYVDSIWKSYGGRFGDIVKTVWGNYLLLPENLEQAVRLTPWRRWSGVEVLMSSTHDPYLPQLADGARRILEAALPDGVSFCIQTRSALALRDLPLIAEYGEQVRLQVSVATMSRDLSRLIEPRVPPVESRLKLLTKARDMNVRTGVIIAPVLPPVPQRTDWRQDMKEIFAALSEVRPDFVYGESLHIRGSNIELLARVLGFRITRESLVRLDREAGELFHELCRTYGLKSVWWREYDV